MTALKKVFITLSLLIAIEATPKCKTTNDEEVVCTAGMEDYELVRGLVSDNNRATRITLKSCRITGVEYESFNDLNSLKYLDLSMNKITKLKLGVLDEPKQLTYLNLSYNLLTEFPLGLFDQTTDIEYLDLKGNRINNLELGVFDPLHKLKFIDLSSNSLQGKDLNPYIFDQSPHIVIADFSRNDMTGAPENLLHAFESLEVLNLDRTSLKEVPSFATQTNLETVKHLTLSNNQITALNGGLFNNLHNLETLDLSYNNIDSIASDVITSLRKLQKIVLRNNKIKEIPNYLFQNMPRLITIDLAGNHISYLRVDAFRYSPLKNLNLSNNKITYLEHNFCSQILSNSGGVLKKFLFDPNPWQCACLNDLLQEIKKLGIEYNIARYNGKKAVCVTTNEFNCIRNQTLNDFYIDLYNEVINNKTKN